MEKIIALLQLHGNAKNYNYAKCTTKKILEHFRVPFQ